MAGFVSRKSADRWNRTASIVEGGGAGWHHVPGLYRPPQGQGGGGAGANIIIARVQEEVDHTMATFDATVAAVMLGTGPAVDTVIEVDNFDSGLIDEAAVGNITGAYRDPGTTGEEVFILLKGMNIMCIQGGDNRWKVFQAGGVFDPDDVGGGGGGPSVFSFVTGLGI
jgi:uncharacterized protein YaiE (UPF0345 family)